MFSFSLIQISLEIFLLNSLIFFTFHHCFSFAISDLDHSYYSYFTHTKSLESPLRYS